MASQTSGQPPMKVAILVSDGFEQIELTGPRAALRQHGCDTVIVSPNPGKVQGFHHHDKGELFDVDLPLAQARAQEFDAILLPGGVINGDQLRTLPEALRFVRDMDDDGKPIFVICHGGWILVSAGLVDGRTMTSWPTLRDDIINAGGDWIDSEVVVDGNWVSSRKPDDILAFNQKMLDLLHQKQAGTLSDRRGDQRGIGLAG